MYVVGPISNWDDVKPMFPLYDELNAGMCSARASLTFARPITARYPSIAIHVSEHKSEDDNGGTTSGIFYAPLTLGSDCGYDHVHIWTFHFFGFFNDKSRGELYPDGNSRLVPTDAWVIAEGETELCRNSFGWRKKVSFLATSR